MVKKSMPIAIRPATLNEISAILRIEQQSRTASHWTIDQYTNLIANGIVLVAEQAEVICGFISAQAVAGEWEIENVVAAPEFLRQGIATRLVNEVIKRARRENASIIRLEVRESNQAARSLYEELHFRQERRRFAYYSNPPEDALVYAMRL